jgi:hypothetical protein
MAGHPAHGFEHTRVVHAPGGYLAGDHLVTGGFEGGFVQEGRLRAP